MGKCENMFDTINVSEYDDGRVDGWTDGWMDGWMDQRVNTRGQENKGSSWQ